MSDAPQQPQLRLKPRLKNEADSSQTQPAPPPPSANLETKAQAPAQAAPLGFKLRGPTLPPTADIPAPPPSPPAPPPPAPPAAPIIAAPQSEESGPALGPPPSTTEAAPRLKLRGKETEAATVPAPAALPPQIPSSALVPPAVNTPEAGQAATEDAPRKTFKLSARPPVTAHTHPEGVPPAFLVEAPTPVEAPPPPEPPRQAPEPITSAPFPEASPPVPSAPASLANAPKTPPPFSKPGLPSAPPAPRPKIPHFKPSEKLNLAPGQLPGVNAPKAKPSSKSTKGLGVILLLGLLGLGGYFAYDRFLKVTPPPAPPPQPPKPASATTSVTPPPVTQTPTVTTPPATPPRQAATEEIPLAQMPGKLIAKAQDSIAARRNVEQERIDNPADGKDTPSQRAVPTPSNALPSTPDDTANADKSSPTTYSSIAPGIAATDSSIKTSGKPGTTFRRVVSDFTIRGVFQGTPARAHINGRIVVAGSLADKELGIIFVGVNADDKMLVFQDATGATVMRRY